MESVGAVLAFGGNLIHRFAVPLLRGRRRTGGGRNSEFRIILSLFVEDSHTLMVGGGVRPHNTEQEDISWQPFRTKRR